MANWIHVCFVICCCLCLSSTVPNRNILLLLWLLVLCLPLTENIYIYNAACLSLLLLISFYISPTMFHIYISPLVFLLAFHLHFSKSGYMFSFHKIFMKKLLKFLPVNLCSWFSVYSIFFFFLISLLHTIEILFVGPVLVDRFCSAFFSSFVLLHENEMKKSQWIRTYNMTGYSSCHSCSITVIVDCYSLAPGHSKKMPMHIQMAFFIEALGIPILVRIVIAQKLAWAPPNILQNTNDVDSIYLLYLAWIKNASMNIRGMTAHFVLFQTSTIFVMSDSIVEQGYCLLLLDGFSSFFFVVVVCAVEGLNE